MSLGSLYPYIPDEHIDLWVRSLTKEQVGLLRGVWFPTALYEKSFVPGGELLRFVCSAVDTQEGRDETKARLDEVVTGMTHIGGFENYRASEVASELLLRIEELEDFPKSVFDVIIKLRKRLGELE